MYRLGAAGGRAEALVRGRVRRVTALTLHEEGARLYFVDGYYGTLETVRTDGSGRTLLAEFRLRPHGAPIAPHVYQDGGLLFKLVYNHEKEKEI